MSKTKIHEFKTYYSNQYGKQSIPVNVFIRNLPQNSTANVHSTVEFGCSWFIVYSVQSGDGQTELFYELVIDSGGHDYVLEINYDSKKAICSFDLNDRIVFVNSDNQELVKQQTGFYEYMITNEMSQEFKIFLFIYKDNLLLFWNDDRAKVIVKKLNLSSLPEFYDYDDFTRVGIDIDLTDESCKITFFTNISPSNTYYSAYIDIMSFLDSNRMSVVLYDHRIDQMSCSPFNGSQFELDTCDKIGDFTLNMTHYEDGEIQKNDSDSGSDSGSGSDSDSGSDSGSDSDSKYNY